MTYTCASGSQERSMIPRDSGSRHRSVPERTFSKNWGACYRRDAHFSISRFTRRIHVKKENSSSLFLSLLALSPAHLLPVRQHGSSTQTLSIRGQRQSLTFKPAVGRGSLVSVGVCANASKNRCSPVCSDVRAIFSRGCYVNVDGSNDDVDVKLARVLRSFLSHSSSTCSSFPFVHHRVSKMVRFSRVFFAVTERATPGRVVTRVQAKPN